MSAMEVNKIYRNWVAGATMLIAVVILAGFATTASSQDYKSDPLAGAGAGGPKQSASTAEPSAPPASSGGSSGQDQSVGSSDSGSGAVATFHVGESLTVSFQDLTQPVAPIETS